MMSDKARFCVVIAGGILLALFMVAMTWFGICSFDGGGDSVRSVGKRGKTYRAYPRIVHVAKMVGPPRRGGRRILRMAN